MNFLKTIYVETNKQKKKKTDQISLKNANFQTRHENILFKNSNFFTSDSNNLPSQFT